MGDPKVTAKMSESFTLSLETQDQLSVSTHVQI
jgi:hypothetical protein